MHKQLIPSSLDAKWRFGTDFYYSLYVDIKVKGESMKKLEVVFYLSVPHSLFFSCFIIIIV